MGKWVEPTDESCNVLVIHESGMAIWAKVPDKESVWMMGVGEDTTHSHFACWDDVANDPAVQAVYVLGILVEYEEEVEP